MSKNYISATQAAQAADEIIRLANIAKTYAAKLNDEQPATDQSPAINAAMKQEEQLRESGDETVIIAAFQEIAKIATASAEGIVPDDEIVKMEPIGGATEIVKTGEGSSATESWATFERVPAETLKDGTTEIISPAPADTSSTELPITEGSSQPA